MTGSHSIKVGFNEAVGYIQATNYFFNNQPMAFRSKTTQPDPNVFFNGTPNFNQVTYWATPTTAKNDQGHDLGLFAQDKWTMKRMTVNYGLRFDYFRSSFPDQELTPATALMALSRPRGGSRCYAADCATQRVRPTT